MSARQDIDREAIAPRRPPRGQKADLFKWVNDQQQLDMRTKFILKELAAFAGPDCCAWCKVDDLAYAANCTVRTVQYHLAALQEAGLIKATGRLHRLENSTRSVPWWQLAPDVEGLGAAEGMGAKIAPIAPAPMGEAQAAPMAEPWVQSGEGMGATGLHPHMENSGEHTGAKAPSPRAREAAFAELERATPKALLKYADRGVAFAAFCDLLDAGVTVAQLVAAAGRMAADPAFKTRKYPPALEDWLGKGQWRGWDGEDAPGAGMHPASAPIGSPVPPEIEAVFLAVIGAGKVGSYLKPCSFEAGPPARLVARTGIARDWLDREIRADAQLRALGLVVDVQGRG